MQFTINGHVYAEKRYGTDDYRFSFYGCSRNDCFGLYVCEHEITLDVPADWNPVAAEVAQLEAEKRGAIEDCRATVSRINERLSKLQAITNEVAA